MTAKNSDSVYVKIEPAYLILNAAAASERLNYNEFLNHYALPSSGANNGMLYPAVQTRICGLCNEQFTDETKFRTHLSSHVMKMERKQELKQTFPHPPELWNRLQLSADSSKVSRSEVVNSLTTYKTSSPSSMRRQKEYKDNPYQCSECNKTFAQLGTLATHRLTHTGEKPYKCDVCEKRFVQVGNLATHKLIHTGEKRFKCEVCGKCFSQLSNIIAHNRIHTGEKPFTCTLCFRSFTQMANLTSHKLIHSGEKPFRCDICDKAFAQAGNLSSHRFTHSGEKPFKCEQCNKSFAQLGNLNTHKMIHTGVKPFGCNICPKAFPQLSHLNAHKKRVHFITPPTKTERH